MNDALFALTDGFAVVTGAASGIGRSIARGVAAQGAPVACVDLAGSGLDGVVEAIGADGGRALALAADVTDTDAMQRAIRSAGREFGDLAYAVNCAGVNRPVLADRLTRADWDHVMEVNARAAVMCTQLEGAAMSGGGSIVNIASISATIINHGEAQLPYYASKAAIKHSTKAFAAEWGSRGIRVNCLSPGPTETPMTPLTDAERAAITARTPLPRTAQPDEMIGPAVFLLSGAASFVTGIDLVVDGGYSVH